MRITTYSIIFILLIGAIASQGSSSVAAQDALAETTSFAPSAGAQCLPSIDPTLAPNLLYWEPPAGTDFEPGDLVTFRVRDYNFWVDIWVLNGVQIAVPTPTPRPTHIPPTPTFEPYPAPNATSTPPPSEPYPAPIQAAATAYATCKIPTYNCITATMPNSCQLVAGAIGQYSPPPIPASPTGPQSIPEPITVVLFGVGATGLAGYARWRRRIENSIEHRPSIEEI